MPVRRIGFFVGEIVTLVLSSPIIAAVATIMILTELQVTMENEILTPQIISPFDPRCGESSGYTLVETVSMDGKQRKACMRIENAYFDN
jgi:hypothetical protein